jgi:hypothetical protein
VWYAGVVVKGFGALQYALGVRPAALPRLHNVTGCASCVDGNFLGQDPAAEIDPSITVF